MRKYEFYQLDVFTDHAFTGNPLAVFTDGRDLSDAEMQQIANEMNLSETVFVLPSENALRRLRIFTPRRELPLAGHPVVGTWFLLAYLGITPQIEKGSVEIKQELNLGVLPVEIEFFDGQPQTVTMTQGKFAAGEIISEPREIENLANSLGLAVEDIISRDDLPIQTVSTGIGSLAVPVASLEKLKSTKINPSLLSEIYLAKKAIGCYAFAFETIKAGSNIHARFFAPDDNIPEDPATGSAAGSLSGYLLHHGAVEPGKLLIEQGDFINRPSRIFAEVFGTQGNVKKVKIGGRSIIVAKGEVFFSY